MLNRVMMERMGILKASQHYNEIQIKGPDLRMEV